MAKYYLGIDLGGTQVKVAVVDGDGLIREESKIDNHIKSVPAELVKKIVSQSKKLKDLS